MDTLKSPTELLRHVLGWGKNVVGSKGSPLTAHPEAVSALIGKGASATRPWREFLTAFWEALDLPRQQDVASWIVTVSFCITHFSYTPHRTGKERTYDLQCDQDSPPVSLVSIRKDVSTNNRNKLDKIITTAFDGFHRENSLSLVETKRAETNRQSMSLLRFVPFLNR